MNMDTLSSSHGVAMGARALAALPPAHDDTPHLHHFLVGTSIAQDKENQIHVYEYNEDTNTLAEVIVYDHPHEIVSITTSHALQDKAFTCYYVDPSSSSSHSHSSGNTRSDVDAWYAPDTAIALWSIPRSHDAKAAESDAEAEAEAEDKSDVVRGQGDDHGRRSKERGIDLRSGKTKGRRLRQILQLGSVPFEASIFDQLPMSLCKGYSPASPFELLWNMESTAVSSPPSATLPGDATLLTLHYGGIATWQLDRGVSTISCLGHSNVPLTSPITCGAWDPHRPQTFAATANGTTLRLWDIRGASIEPAGIVSAAHSGVIASVDFNPNKPHHLATGGADGLVYVWDLRKTTTPVLTLQGHYNAVNTVRHNRFHDQLLLTSGADGAVNLWNALSTSSVPSGGGSTVNDMAFGASTADLTSHSVAIGPGYGGPTTPGATGTSPTTPAGSAPADRSAKGTAAHSAAEKDSDRLIRRYTDFDESVLGLTWSRVHAWVFASLSVDGRFQVTQVPPAEKYRILL